MSDDGSLPLNGVRVLDFTQVLSGPYCTMMLGDLGAEVIRVEPMTVEHRHLGARYGEADGSVYMIVNRNKESVALDLKDPEALDACHMLASSVDVVVENFRPGVAARLGIGWEDLSTINPSLIYASISGFGQYGPYAERPGYDLLVQGMSGLMSVTGEPDRGPAKCGIPVSDLAAGLFASNAIIAALFDRTRSGCGRQIDVSLLDSALALSVWEAAAVWTSGSAPTRLGAHHRGTAPYGAVKSATGEVILALNTERFWAIFCEEFARLDLLNDARFSTNETRLEHRDALIAAIEETTRQFPGDQLVERLVARGIPAAPIRNYLESLTDEHADARAMVYDVRDPRVGSYKALGSPVKLTPSYSPVRYRAPTHGEHTVGVLRSAGLTDAQIDRLLERGAAKASTEPR